MDLHQKVVFVSKEAAAGPKYKVEQVEAMFLHSLQTAFQSEGVKMDMRPYLQSPTVGDKELLEKLNNAASHETKQQQKLYPSKNVTVSSLANNVPESDPPKPPTLSSSKSNPLADKIQELKTQVPALVCTLQTRGNISADPPRRTPRPRGPTQRMWLSMVPRA